jgi:hypothetical protein
MVGLVNWRVEMLGRLFSRLEAFGVFVERVGLEIGDLDGVNCATASLDVHRALPQYHHYSAHLSNVY